MTTTGLAETHSLTGYEPNLTNKQHLVLWKSTPFWVGKRVWTNYLESSMEKCATLHRGTTSLQLSESVGRATCSMARARQKRFELSKKPASKKAAQEYEQAARDEVNIAVVRATEMSGAEVLARMGALGNQAE